MKKNYYLSIFIFCSSVVTAQVGINTTNPEATLDVNGDIIIRQVGNANSSANYDFLVVDPTTHKVDKVNGNLSGSSGSNVNSTMAKAIEDEGLSLLDGSLFAGWQKIDFGSGHIPINPGGHFSAADDIYTVPSDGVYVINFDVRYGSGVMLAALNFSGIPSIGILKHSSDMSSYTVMDKKKFSGASVSFLASIIISNTSIDSIYRLSKNDKLSFEINAGGLALNLLSDSSARVYIYKISD